MRFLFTRVFSGVLTLDEDDSPGHNDLIFIVRERTDMKGSTTHRIEKRSEKPEWNNCFIKN